MANSPPCPFGRAAHQLARQHEHEYRPPPLGQRQCSCGSRAWIIRVGGLLPASVECSRCRKPSRLNTLYEAGRLTGQREGWKARQDADAGEAVPF